MAVDDRLCFEDVRRARNIGTTQHRGATPQTCLNAKGLIKNVSGGGGSDVYVIRRKNLVCIIRDDQGRGMKGIEHLDDGRCIHCKIVREARNKIDEARTGTKTFLLNF